MHRNIYNIIYTIVERGEADKIVDAAKNAGVEGATIFFARGTGIHECKKFFGIPVESEREVIMVLIKKSKTEQVLEAIVKAGELEKPGRGMAFVQDVPIVAGIVHLEGCGEKLEKAKKDEQ